MDFFVTLKSLSRSKILMVGVIEVSSIDCVEAVEDLLSSYYKMPVLLLPILKPGTQQTIDLTLNL
jgi:hypothetical protein